MNIQRTPHILWHCELCGLTVRCGTCRNNMCNGGTGADGTCTDCESAYELLQRDFTIPVVYAAVEATSDDIHAWLIRALKRLPDSAGANDPEWVCQQIVELTDRATADLHELRRALVVQEEP